MKSERNDIAREHLVKHRNTVEILSDDKFYSVVHKIAELCSEALSNGKKIIFMGNGGSAADAQHLAAELVGRYLEDRLALAAMALNVNTSILTAVANDYSYEDIFSRQVEGIGNNGDVLIGLSTSGRSINIIKGLKAGKKKGLKTAAFVGNYVDDVKDICDVVLTIPEKHTPIIQEMHIMAGHIICGIIEHNIKMKNETSGFEAVDV
jgi:D-sedoheptulose 7-phosphate isomerase